MIDWEDGGESVKIDVEANYFSQAALDRANVCSISRKAGENGIGIFVSDCVQTLNTDDADIHDW